jgi:hypothetical protein
MARTVLAVKKAVKKKAAPAVKKAVKKKAVSAAKKAVKKKKNPKSDEGRAWLCYMRADGVHVVVPFDGDYSVPPPKELWPDGKHKWPPPPDKRGNLEATDRIRAVMK